WRAGKIRRSTGARRPISERRPSCSRNATRRSSTVVGSSLRKRRAWFSQSVTSRSSIKKRRNFGGAARLPRVLQTSHWRTIPIARPRLRGTAKFSALLRRGSALDPRDHVLFHWAPHEAPELLNAGRARDVHLDQLFTDQVQADEPQAVLDELGTHR